MDAANSPIKPFIRVFLFVTVLTMLFFAPTREFLKITFIMGIPGLLFYSLMGRQTRYSPLWIICGLLVLGVLLFYGYLLLHLPERIESREIISQGGTLVAEGKYDQAIDKYKQLEKLGQKAKMEDKISQARLEKSAQQQLEQARQKLAAGDKQGAREIIEKIPPGTRAASQARELRSQLKP
ncbi:Uncharacterized [Syntrophomonas zehnderi OL-4]|uniref:Uncharacterized n=1 Tax=Syntrophomonas zehnderi OL-4 TaxID=690567 RepID=A0A0E4GC51_9FIRM|nr:hypothetical protein [Syntrophomonas zehnderi]CFY03513.1 Uncharacterized [Syntrophomonas zehnderi OL-4]